MPATTALDPAPAAPAAPTPAGHELALAWTRANPAAAAAVGVLTLTLAIFYLVVPLFYVPARHGFITAGRWIWEAWNPESHYEHGKLIPPILLFLLWDAIPRLRGLRPAPSLLGLVPFAFGVGLYLLSARALQPRLAWAGLPFLLGGGVLYAAGWRWARVLLFPILCCFFLIPVPGVDQATVQLQVMATKAANLVCNVIGIKMRAVGTTLVAQDDSFQFQVVGDCSGINSLMAITLMTAIFAHLTQDRLWKKGLLFMASVPVAIVGNIARLTSIMLVAKCFGQGAASGFHEVSAYVVSFPFAFGTLCLVNKLLNWGTQARPSGGGAGTRPRPVAPAVSQPLAVAGGGRPTSEYDY